MGYEYDIFISYRNDKFFSEWVYNVLYETLEPLLKNELNQSEVRIFMDKEEIRTGDEWSNRIKRALVRSRCLVPVFIPNYFHSEWCVRELSVLLHRQTALKYNTLNNPSGLVLPIHLFDGEHFPELAKDIQGKNFKSYFRPNLTGDLQNKFFAEMIEWVKIIADAVKNAPAWNDDWLKPEWLEEPYSKLMAEIEEERKQEEEKPPEL